MKKLYIISLLSVFLTTPAWATDTFICSYTAQISPQDKLNSSGKSIISGYDKKSVIAILRQDRANYHTLHKRDKLINLIPKIAKHAPKLGTTTLNIFYKPVHFLHKASP